MSIIFYEKQDCQNNRKQKLILKQHGLELDVQNLFEQDWTAERLRPFFLNKPLSDWFNPAAPRIKNGEVRPEYFDEDSALAAMVEDPFLIRRPLIQYGQIYISGFDWALLTTILPISDANPLEEDVVSCTHSTQENHDHEHTHTCGCRKAK